MKIAKLLGIAAMAAMVLAVCVEANAKSTIANSPCKEDRQRLCPQFPNGSAGPCHCGAATDWWNHVEIKPRADQPRQSQKMCAFA